MASQTIQLIANDMSELLNGEEWELLKLLAKRANSGSFDPSTWHSYVNCKKTQREIWTCGICHVGMGDVEPSTMENEQHNELSRKIALHGRQHLKNSGLLPFL